MTDSRFWGNMACLFLVGSGIALAMAGFQDQQQLIWAIAANGLTLCFALCLNFRYEARLESITKVCDGFKVIVTAWLNTETPVCEPVSSELEESIDSFPRIRGD